MWLQFIACACPQNVHNVYWIFLTIFFANEIEKLIFLLQVIITFANKQLKLISPLSLCYQQMTINREPVPQSQVQTISNEVTQLLAHQAQHRSLQEST